MISVRKNYKFLFALLLAVTPALFVMAKPAQEDRSRSLQKEFYEEQKKWHYLRDKLNMSIQDRKTFLVGFGSFLKDYAHLIAIPALPLGVYLGNVFLSPESGSWVRYPREVVSSFCQNDPMRRFITVCGLSCFALILYYLTCCFCSYVGNWLTCDPVPCRQCLIDFLQHWDEHERYVPETAKLIFASLLKNFDKKTNTIKNLDDKASCMIVQSFLASEIVIDSLV